MNYDEILDKFYDFIGSEFDLQHLDKLKKLYEELQGCFNLLVTDAMSKNNKGKVAALKRDYLGVCEMLKTAMCTKLQEKLDLENEIIVDINNIINMYCDRIREIHVLDGTIVVWFKDESVPKLYEPLDEELYGYKVSDEFFYSEPLGGKTLVDMTSNKFYCNNDGEDSKYYELANYIISTIRGVIKPVLLGSGVDNDLITITPKRINYAVPGLHIFFSNDLRNISSDKTGTKITKVIVAYQNKVLYYDLKIRHDRELSDSGIGLLFNGDQPHMLSEILSGTGKTGGEAIGI